MTRHGFPCDLPRGERILWQGGPDWRALARDALHLRGLALYFAGLVAWLGASEVWGGTAAGVVFRDTALAGLVACVPLALGLGYAYFAARAATYTITDRRVVVRMGAAMPMTVNLPFAKIEAAGLRARSGGTGEISLKLPKGERFSSIVMWPHSHVLSGQPTLRALVDAERAGRVLSEALAASVDLPPRMPIPLAPRERIGETRGQDGGGNAIDTQVHGLTVAA